MFRHKQQKLDKIREKLSAQMKEALDNEDERIENALREREEKFVKEEKEKEAKSKKMLHEIAQHRSVQVMFD